MNTEPRKLLKGLVRSVVAKILPLSLRQEYIHALEKRCASLSQLIAESVRDACMVPRAVEGTYSGEHI